MHIDEDKHKQIDIDRHHRLPATYFLSAASRKANLRSPGGRCDVSAETSRNWIPPRVIQAPKDREAPSILPGRHGCHRSRMSDCHCQLADYDWPQSYLGSWWSGDGVGAINLGSFPTAARGLAKGPGSGSSAEHQFGMRSTGQERILADGWGRNDQCGRPGNIAGCIISIRKATLRSPSGHCGVSAETSRNTLLAKRCQH